MGHQAIGHAPYRCEGDAAKVGAVFSEALGSGVAIGIYVGRWLMWRESRIGVGVRWRFAKAIGLEGGSCRDRRLVFAEIPPSFGR